MLPLSILLLGTLAAADLERPCATSLIRGVPTEEVNFDFYDPAGASGARLRVQCVGNSSLKAIKLHSGPDTLRSDVYDSLSCDASRGWTANENEIADATSPVTISCFEYTHCNPSLLKGVRADEINVSTDSQGRKTMFCKYGSSSLTGVNVNGAPHEGPYESLACDQHGWHGAAEGGHHYLGTKDPSSLTVSCVEYCAAAGSGIKSTHRKHPTAFLAGTYYNEITCADSSHKLFHNGNRVKDDIADCKLSTSTWKFGQTDYSDLSSNGRTGSPTELSIWSTQPFECKSDSTGKRFARAMRTVEGKQEE